MAADNKILGQFDLVGLPPAPRGVPQVEVAFDIDANGIVSVTATDKATGKEQQIRIQASGGLSDDEIERMVQEAEANAEEDRQRRELADARNAADAMIHQTGKSLSEHGDKIEATEKEAIEKAMEDLKAVKDEDDLGAIQEKTQALMQASMKLGEAMYAAQQAEAEAAGPGAAEDADSAEATSGEGVVDADFEEVDDDEQKKAS